MAKTKVVNVALYTKMNEGIAAHFPLKTPIEVAGVKITPGAIQARIQARVDKSKATEAAKQAYHLAVEAEGVAEADANTLRAQFKSFVEGKFGATSATLKEFGFKPAAVPVVSAATRAQASEQGKATRKARGTMGKKQRQKADREAKAAAKGAAPAVPATAPAEATASPAAAPAAPAAAPTVNGANGHAGT